MTTLVILSRKPRDHQNQAKKEEKLTCILVRKELTILGGRARSEARPLFVRLSSIFLRIFCFSKNIARCPLEVFPCNCIGVATF